MGIGNLRFRRRDRRWYDGGKSVRLYGDCCGMGMIRTEKSLWKGGKCREIMDGVLSGRVGSRREGLKKGVDDRW